jgi:hypothetical protein
MMDEIANPIGKPVKVAVIKTNGRNEIARIISETTRCLFNPARNLWMLFLPRLSSRPLNTLFGAVMCSRYPAVDLPPTSALRRRNDGPKDSHALTFNLDHSSGAAH